MLDQMQAAHSHTPTLAVSDPRAKVMRAVSYFRSSTAGTTQALVDRTVHDPAGRAIKLWDPRLFESALAPSNLSNVHSLSGVILTSNSVDAGLRISLFGEAGQPVQGWDGRGSQRWMRYDKQLRLSELFEQAAGGDAVCAERLAYASNDQAFADHNQCGRLIRHEDPAGVLLCNDYGLNGTVLEQERRLCPQKMEGFITHSQFNPPGELISVTDARGNQQRFHQTVGGSLRAVDLRLDGTFEWLPIVRTVTYNTHGQVEQEVAGNRVITTLEYGAEDGRLKRLLSRLDTNAPLQDLHYTYDPVGNVLSIEDAALPIRFFANQRIEPISHFLYDTLYRLVQATGWEAGAVKHGASASQSADPAMPCNYRQTYRYDAGGNLLELTHVGAQDPGHRMVAETHSNRCLPVLNGVEPTENDFRNGFDANGNLLQLQPGQTLSWDVRNQLREVRPVERDGPDDDIERYEYGADGMRVRKVRSLQTGTQTNTIETRYLPGLQIRTHSGTGEELHVIEVSTGRGSVRVLHWKAGKPKDIPNNQERYNLTDHLGSSTLELDQHANMITQERYYPFGGTAWSSGEAVQVSYKTVRYSGKEQDATGVYYYGFRYYVPWLQRWLTPDPLGEIDGLNLYGMVKNNPGSLVDNDGRSSEVPKNIHYIWIGEDSERLLLDVPGISQSALLNSDHEVTVHVDTKDPRRYAAVVAEFRKLGAAVNVSFLREDQKFFKEFTCTKSYAVYSDLNNGNPKNYAAASDVLRYSLLDYYGGIYSDTDDRFIRGIRSDDFAHKRGRIFTVRPSSLPWRPGSFGVSNNSFAAHANNPTLKKIINQIVTRYSQFGGQGLSLAMDGMSDVNRRMKLVSSITGPEMFTDVMRNSSSGYRRTFDQIVGKKISMSLERQGEEVDKRMTMSRFITTGSAHTWE